MPPTPPAALSTTDRHTLSLCSAANLIIQTPRRSWACVLQNAATQSLSNPSLKRLIESGHLDESAITASLGEGGPTGPVLFLTQKGRDALKP